MPEDLMRYDVMTQDALRGVVKAALKVAEKSGLPGDHHFYIAFKTRAEGVRMSERLRQKYPTEMTVVLQHQYWNLAVRDDEFEVELNFNEIPERLVIPFTAIKGFLDPSVQFGLQFESMNIEASGEKMSSANPPAVEPPKQSEDQAASAEPPKVVSLDAFRKK